MTMAATNQVYRKHLFDIPDDLVYLDGNSLGPLPKDVGFRAGNTISDEWGKSLIRGWNDCKWMEQPGRVGDLVARLIGAKPGTVMMGDTLSIKVFQALAAALKMRPGRKIILSDTGNFPTDLYMANGLTGFLNSGHTVKTVDPEKVFNAIDETVAVVMLTQVDYRTGRMHDMEQITRKAHDAGAVMIWDLAHSAGAVEVDLAGSRCEFAIGCTYKYLNGGPGAPAFIYVRPDLVDKTVPVLSGWLGHDAPFAFDPDYRPAGSIERMRVGTPPVIQLSCLEEALKVWKDLDMKDVRAASIDLSQLFIEEVEKKCPELQLASPRNSADRGSQVSFRFENGFAAMQALIARGVIGDFRAPDIMRFGLTPLYVNRDDVLKAANILEEVMTNKLWDHPQYRRTQKVT